MKITNEILVTSSSQKKRRDETEAQFLERITHLKLNGKGISKIENLSECKSLEVLYLYDNEIRIVENLTFAEKTLSHLYLQNNKIISTKGLHTLTKIDKLYLNSNCLSFVEGLQNLNDLEEMYISHQTPEEKNEQLTFSQISINTIRTSLRILDISHNNLFDLTQISQLSNLKILNLSSNLIADLAEVAKLLTGCLYIQELDLRNNPICKHREYRKEVIPLTNSTLKLLDDKEILLNEREFLKSLASKKQKKNSASSLNLSSPSDLFVQAHKATQ